MPIEFHFDLGLAERTTAISFYTVAFFIICAAKRRSGAAPPLFDRILRSKPAIMCVTLCRNLTASLLGWGHSVHVERRTRQRRRAEASAQLGAVRGIRWAALLTVMLSGPPLMSLTFSVIAPVLPAIARHFAASGGGALFAQWIMTAPAIGLMLGGPTGGALIDRVGPRPLIIGSFGLFALAGSAGLWLNDAFGLLVSRFLLGLAGSCIATAATWLIGERFDEVARRRVIGIQDSAAGIAAMSAVLLSGVAGASGGWRLPFAIYAVAAPLMLLALVSVPRVVATVATRQEPSAWNPLRAHWRTYAIVLAMAGLMMLPATQVPFLLEGAGVSDPIVRSRVIASSAALSIVSAALYGPVRHLLAERGTMALIILAYALGTTMLGRSHDAWSAAFGCMMLGAGTGLFSPHFASVLIARTPPPARGRAIGFMYGAIFLSEFLSPLAILPLRSLFGVHGGFLALGAALLVGFVTALLAKPSIRRTGSTRGIET